MKLCAKILFRKNACEMFPDIFPIVNLWGEKKLVELWKIGQPGYPQKEVQSRDFGKQERTVKKSEEHIEDLGERHS